MNRLQRLCPHRFGWSYNTSRSVRFCRLCAQRQHKQRDGTYADYLRSVR